MNFKKASAIIGISTATMLSLTGCNNSKAGKDLQVTDTVVEQKVDTEQTSEKTETAEETENITETTEEETSEVEGSDTIEKSTDTVENEEDILKSAVCVYGPAPKQ